LRASVGQWKHRGPLVFAEIIHQEPDIVCLQELDQFEYFQERLLPRGFAGIFERRSPTETLSYYVSKGLAIFWRTDKFELMGRGVYSLRSDPADTRQDHIGLLARLRRREPYDTKRALGEIDVWNAHLLTGSGNRPQQVRLGQVMVLFDIIGNESNTELIEKHHGSKEEAYKNKLEKEMQSKENKEKLSENEPSIKDLQQMFKRRMEQAIAETTKSSSTEKLVTENKNQTKNEENPSNSIEKQEKKDNEYKPGLVGGPTHLQRPVILCVDCSDHSPFEADRKSIPLVYTYLTNRSRTTDSHPEYRRILPGELKQQHARHSWFLQSAYALGFGREPPFTCCISQQLTLASDLILFTPQNFRVINLLEPLSREWVEQQETKTLPCRNYPSDHYLIGCDLELAIGHSTTNNPITGTGVNVNNTNNMIPESNRLPNPNYGTNAPMMAAPNSNMNLYMSAPPHFGNVLTQPMDNQGGVSNLNFIQQPVMASQTVPLKIPTQR